MLLEPKWSEKDIEFDVELESLEYTGSEALLFHVWSNLIGNAVKFNSSGGYVGVRLERKKGGVRVQVDDNGPGIPEESLEHIFDKFYQSDSSHKSEGNGLGLAPCKAYTGFERRKHMRGKSVRRRLPFYSLSANVM